MSSASAARGRRCGLKRVARGAQLTTPSGATSEGLIASCRVRVYVLVMRLLAIVLATFIGAADAQSDPPVVCPLSEDQVRNSIEAFSKLVPTLTSEPRCVNCHGGLDVFSSESNHPEVFPPSETAAGSDCSVCHDNMAPRADGSPSEWSLAPAFLSFVGKSNTQLCKQIKEFSNGPCAGGSCYRWPSAEKFIAHVINDEGRDNFTATAFAGTRGLNPEAFRIAPAPPRDITHAQLIALAREWVGTTGGEWQGKQDCGCSPSRYALRVKIVTEFDDEDGVFHNVMGPVDIPIEFKEDGSFTGESDLGSKGSGVSGDCLLQASGGLRLAVSGKAVQKWNEQYIRAEFRSASASSFGGSVRCPDDSAAGQITGRNDDVHMVELKGVVGEVGHMHIPAPAPGIKNTATVEIITRE